MANAPKFVLLLSVIGIGASALAEEIQPANEAKVDEALDEIVVTATRRETPLQETALSVAALTGDYLDEAGLRDFDDYWRQVPSLAIAESGPFGTQAVIRGMSANFGAVSDEPLSALYFDETPLTNPAGYFTAPPDVYLVDMERVEVLRGPQGTLFGASSMGGAIRYISNKPDLTSSQFSVDSGFSTTDHGGNNTELSGVFNHVLVPESSALRLVAYYRDDAGFIDDIGLQRRDINWRETQGLRLSATSVINDRLSITGFDVLI